jgi:hypothetical protein
MSDGRASRSKVDRVIGRYDLTGLGDTLEERWTRETGRSSLRELAAYFNRRVLRSALEEQGVRPLDSEIENYCQLLTDADAQAGDREQVRRRLQRHGVDVKQLQTDFVSHQTVHTYLRDHRDASRDSERSPADQRRAVRERINRLRGRTEAVVTESLQGLARNDELSLDKFDTIVDVRVVDTTTGETFDVEQLLNDE